MITSAEEKARERRARQEAPATFCSEASATFCSEAPATFCSEAFNLLLRCGLSQRKALYLSCCLDDIAKAQYAGDADAAKRADESMLQHEIRTGKRRR
jgi:hypothetical protein